jgi:tetratricopeptide (TPR) repeat protein
MDDNPANAPSRPDYLTAYLGLTWQTDVNAGLRTWLEAFQEALDNWQDDVCQRLLREIKPVPLTPEVEGLVRYVEGRWAEQRGDLNQAVSSYQASLDLNRAAGAALRLAQVLGDLGLAYYALGRLSEAEESLRHAIEIYRAAEENDAVFGVLNDLGTVLIGQGKWVAARTCFNEALDRATDTNDEAIALGNLGVWYQAQGRSAEAQEQFQHALANFRTSGSHANAASMLNNLGALALDNRRPEDAEAYLVEALAIYQSLCDWSNVVRSLGNLALLSQEKGEAEQALQRYSDAIESVQDLADTRTVAVLYNHRGLLHAESDEWELAVTDLEQSLRHLTNTGDQPTQIDVLNNLGTAYHHLDRLDEAHTCYEEAMELAEALEDRRRLGEILGNLGHLYDLQDEPDRAMVCYRNSLSIAEEFQDPFMEAVALIGLCSLVWQKGDLETLDALLDRTWRLGETTGQPDVLARAGWLRGDLSLVREEGVSQVFEHYALATVHAGEAGEALLAATLERIDIHLEPLAESNQSDAVAEACRVLETNWLSEDLFDVYPDLRSYLHEWRTLDLTSMTDREA